MLRKDYYLILGVSRRQNLRGIDEAFRELAKICHPDRAGPEGPRKFQEIRQAYESLSNVEKRESYNRELEQQEELNPQSLPGPIISRPQARPALLAPEPMSVLHDFEIIRPSFEPLFERFIRNFTGKRIPKGERLEALNVEVILSAEEAARGVTVAFGVPVFYSCRHCNGAGHNWLFPCVSCDSEGMVEGKESLWVRVPPMAPAGSIIEASVQGLGINNFYLRLHTRISP
jgi:DnaJ-class molecular chaperone